MRAWALPVILGLLVPSSAFADPILEDNRLAAENFVSGIDRATSMVFIGDDILVLQKDDGKVRLVRDGILQSRPVLDANVANAGEQGMLGIANVGSTVYLYFTESDRDGGEALGKRVYKYAWNGGELVNAHLLRDLPQTQAFHNGGAMVTDLDGSAYLILGDAGRFGKLQNQPTGEPDDTSVILRVAPEGPYRAIGIRNSFGLAVDPLTGNLWDTENGASDYDEVNLVADGFNSGWNAIMGPATEQQISSLPGYNGYTYSDPEFSWEQIVVPTALVFPVSNEMAEYRNSLLVGTCSNGNLYRFAVNESRDGFMFMDPGLSDRIANGDDLQEEIIVGTGFGCITDMEMGPDGFLYLTSFSEGAILRIVPRTLLPEPNTAPDGNLAPYVILAASLGAAGIIVAYIIKRRNPR
jgi:glucose/arabinose dehydrogenase